jgi:hypothetical protein
LHQAGCTFDTVWVSEHPREVARIERLEQLAIHISG